MCYSNADGVDLGRFAFLNCLEVQAILESFSLSLALRPENCRDVHFAVLATSGRKAEARGLGCVHHSAQSIFTSHASLKKLYESSCKHVRFVAVA